MNAHLRQQDEIVVSGEKDAVARAAAEINLIYEQKVILQ